MNAFKSIRYIERTKEHIIVRATINIEQLFSDFKRDSQINRFQEYLSIKILAIGMKLYDNLKISYPYHAIITTDVENIKAISGVKSDAIITTRYLRGRWYLDKKPFKMYFLGHGEYQLTDFISEAIGATISFADKPTWPIGRHENYLILSKVKISDGIANELTLARDADMFERSILLKDALLIYPEFDEGLMPPKWERDPLFSDHNLVELSDDIPPSIVDVYIIGKDQKILDTMNNLKLP